MSSLVTHAFVSGVFVAAALAITFFYVKYWRRVHERLFISLAAAFLLLAAERGILAFVPPGTEGRHYIFVMRVLAFALIIGGIIEKNRPRRGDSSRQADDSA